MSSSPNSDLPIRTSTAFSTVAECRRLRMRRSLSARLWCIEDDRDRAVIDELELHLRAEHSRLDRDAERAQLVAEALVERLRLLGWRGVDEARAVSLRRVGDERELGDDHHAAGGV